VTASSKEQGQVHFFAPYLAKNGVTISSPSAIGASLPGRLEDQQQDPFAI
jgi:hypothetical protein